MTVANCFVDLIDIQGSSVLVCFEDGWDATAQVSVQCGFVYHSIACQFCFGKTTMRDKGVEKLL